MKPYPLMIGGCPRSGTTALVQMFNSNPSVHISAEENLLNTVEVLEKLLGTRERRAKVYKEKGTRDLSPRETLSANNILQSNFSRNAVWPMIQHLYQWHHEQQNDSTSLVLWGDKLPNYYKKIDQVLAIDDVRYLHITRNPFDTVNSMLRRTEMAKQGKDWWRAITDINAMIETWEEAYKVIKRIEDRENIFHLHYEELVFDFENSISDLNNFLEVDLTYENVMVNDPNKHYERSFLDQKIIDQMFESEEILDYVEKYSGNKNNPFISEALLNIDLPSKRTEKEKVDPVRVFIAATSSEWLPARVLEFSIREKCTLPVEVLFLYQAEIDIPIPNDLANRAKTPFSFQRFLIPELCSYSGRAIYLDADMLVFEDITNLWNHPFSGCDLQTVQESDSDRRGQFSVMLLDCSHLDWNIKKIVEDLNSHHLDYEGLMYEMKVTSNIGREIVPSWNSLESYSEGTTSLLHYTDMNTQPWISLENPLGHLWIACLRRAISSGFISIDEIDREIVSGHVRPSLSGQLEMNIDDSSLLSIEIKKMDSQFSAPYNNLINGKVKLLLHKLGLKKVYQAGRNSFLYRMFN